MKANLEYSLSCLARRIRKAYPDMLEVGKKRAVERGSFHDLDFKVLNAEDLGVFEDDLYMLYYDSYRHKAYSYIYMF